MARDDPAAGAESAGFDDEVDLSFAGPEPVAAAPWPWRLLDLASAYLPLLMMAVLASGTWWLVRNAPSVEAPRTLAAPRHEADYVMTRFVVQRFGSDGALRTQIEGDRLRHFPDNDTLEVDAARIRAIGNDGTVTLATANKALANGDGSEVQLLGNAHITRPASDKEETIEFRSEFLHAFRNVERVRSHLPVVVTQGQSVVRAEGMEYDNLARVVDLKGHTSATFVAPKKAVTR
jgi:lipopolysaccharide export system protein LptC